MWVVWQSACKMQCKCVHQAYKGNEAWQACVVQSYNTRSCRRKKESCHWAISTPHFTVVQSVLTAQIHSIPWPAATRPPHQELLELLRLGHDAASGWAHACTRPPVACLGQAPAPCTTQGAQAGYRRRAQVMGAKLNAWGWPPPAPNAYAAPSSSTAGARFSTSPSSTSKKVSRMLTALL